MIVIWSFINMMEKMRNQYGQVTHMEKKEHNLLFKLMEIQLFMKKMEMLFGLQTFMGREEKD